MPGAVFAQNRLAKLCADASIVLAACLPFLIPFSANRNIDMQGLVLIIAGGFAWASLGLRRFAVLRSFSRNTVVLLGIFMLSCVISAAISPHKGYGLLGIPYVRLGSAGLIAAIGVGLVILPTPVNALIKRLYAVITAIAVLSVPYNLLRFHALHRMNGIVAQADILAALLGCGLLLGLYISQRSSDKKYLLMGNQLFLAILLVLTETRAVLVVTIILYLIWGLRKQPQKVLLRSMIFAIVLFCLLAGLHYFLPNRLTDTRYAVDSFRYRAELQSYALRTSARKPFWGYGPGNLADALACSRLPAGPLQTTCHQGYFFNSSHNIFIDRFLAVGWLGGGAFLAIVGSAIYKGLRSKREIQILAYAVILIAIYYLTNVTSVILELLLWVLLVRCLAIQRNP